MTRGSVTLASAACAWLGLGLALAGAQATDAAEFRAGQHVVIATGEVVEEDLYATGETVTVDGTVLGDLIASGREDGGLRLFSSSG